MVLSWTDGYNTKITAVYWSDGLNCKCIEEYGKGSDYIQIWYPHNLADDTYEKYHELITYIEREAHWKGEAFSLQMDLSLSAEEIFQQFSKTRRYEVRRAKERDNLTVEFLSNFDEMELKAFETYYNRFAKQTNELAALDTEKVRALNEQGQFVLARVKDAEDNLLTIHGYIADCEAGIAALFSSSSYFRENKDKSALIGRANGLLHYESMLYFKRQGFQIYDFGGIYLGKDNEHYMSVAAFKQSFGGKRVVFQNGFLFPIREAQMIDDKLSKLSSQIGNKEVILWGYSSFGKYIERRLKNDFTKQCKYIIDNKLYKEEERCTSEKVLSGLKADNVLILVGTSHENYLKIVSQDNVKRFVENGRIVCLRG